MPYSPEGIALDGDADGAESAAKAGVTVPITVTAARTAALRRTYMIGGCPSLKGPGSTGETPGRLGSVYLDGAVLRPAAGAREPVTNPYGAIRLTGFDGRFTVASQRRNCTGFPLYGCDGDAVTLPARRETAGGGCERR